MINKKELNKHLLSIISDVKNTGGDLKSMMK